MCGGRGTRLGGGTEKPLTTVAGRPMIDRVCDALVGSRVGSIAAVVSPHTPATRAHLTTQGEIGRPPDTHLIDAPGNGYVADLQYALDALEPGDTPVLTVAADLPLLDGNAVNTVIDAASRARPDSLTVCVPATRKRELGVSADTSTVIDDRAIVPAGINAVSTHTTDSAVHVTTDRRIAVNVNYPSDVQVAEALLATTTESTPSNDA